MADTKIKTSNIESLAVTHDKLHTDMDLTGKTVQVPAPTAASHPATKNYVDTEIASVTDFAYNSITEVLTIDTADGSSFTADISGLASETYVNTAVSNLVDSAPGTLDTLNELAAALGDDANFATTVSTNLGNKVDKINITGATVGSGTAIPVITYNAQGQITSATTTAVAGIDTVTFSGGELTISTGDGSDYVTDFDARYFTETEANANFLGINAKAADSDTLDGLNSTQFLRSDANDTFTGNQLKLENSFPSAGGLLLVSDDGTSTTVATGTVFRVTNNGGSASYSVLESSSAESDFVHYNNGVIELSNNTQAPILKLTANPSQLARLEMGDGSNYTHISSRPDLGDGLMFYENGAVNTMMRGGNVGIGTTSPQGKLHVSGGPTLLGVSNDWHQSTSSPVGTTIIRGGWRGTVINNDTTALKIYNAAANTSKTATNYNNGIGFMHLDPETYSGYTGQHAWIGLRIFDTPAQERSALVFATNNETTSGSHPVERMTINPNGYVGIGATNPQAKLHINGTDENIRLDNSGTGNYGLEIWRGGNKGASFAWGEGNANLEIKNYRNDSQADGPYANIDFFTGGTNANSGGSPAYSPELRMRIQQTGEVGIGTTNPRSKLEVNGDGIIFRLDGSPNTSRSMFFRNTSTTNHAQIYADGTLKLWTEDANTSILLAPENNNNYKIEHNANGFAPAEDNQLDLGRYDKGWKNIYTNDLQLSNMNSEEGNEVDGTNGKWTIQEGEEELFIINRLSGKKYAFMLREIE